MTATQLADHLPLSVSATTERLRRLRASGLIRRFTVELDPSAVGRPILVFVDMRLRRGVSKAEADAALLDVQSILDAVHVTGRPMTTSCESRRQTSPTSTGHWHSSSRTWALRRR
ncbi:Lrp/AsnC family transcriptional regulator [Euzebya tangerina]|uniref:Lrp/AsnC family transcriptional regulator n=1 Tax=Euzebya tangerina TaxID=591198 RepID=UPI0039C86251